MTDTPAANTAAAPAAATPTAPAPVKKNVAAAQSSDTPAAEFKQTLAEFCTALSGVDRRVEMVNAFFTSERVAGRTADMPSAYRNRFAQFCKAVPARGKHINKPQSKPKNKAQAQAK